MCCNSDLAARYDALRAYLVSCLARLHSPPPVPAALVCFSVSVFDAAGDAGAPFERPNGPRCYRQHPRQAPSRVPNGAEESFNLKSTRSERAFGSASFKEQRHQKSFAKESEHSLLPAAPYAALSRGQRRREFSLPHQEGMDLFSPAPSWQYIALALCNLSSHFVCPLSLVNIVLSRGHTKRLVVPEAVVASSAPYLLLSSTARILHFSSWFVVLSSYFFFSGIAAVANLRIALCCLVFFFFRVYITSLYHLVCCLVGVCCVRGPSG